MASESDRAVDISVKRWLVGLSACRLVGLSARRLIGFVGLSATSARVGLKKQSGLEKLAMDAAVYSWLNCRSEIL